MSLSSSTINLKFMQRAAVRKAQTAGQSTPARPTPGSSHSTPGPSTPLAGTDIKPSSLVLGESSVPSTPDTRHGSPALVGYQAEQEAKARWVLPRRPRPDGVKPEPGVEASTSRSEGSRVTFESSYLPFIFDSVEDDEAGPSRPTGFSGGGGRMTFGGFGEAPKSVEEEGEEGEEEDKAAEGQVARKGKGKGRQGDEADRSGKRLGENVFRDQDVDGDQAGKRPRDPSKRDQGGDAGSRATPNTVNRDVKPHLPREKPHTTAQGFVRPANYTSDLPRPNLSTPTMPSSATASSRKHQPSSQTDVKPVIPKSSKKSAAAGQQPNTTASPSSPHPAALSVGKTGKKRTKSVASSSGTTSTPVKIESAKRAKLDLSQNIPPASAATASPVAIAAGGGGSDLDARERAIKAEKKREKKAKRKIKAEEGAVVT